MRGRGGGNFERGRQKGGLQYFGKGPAKSGFFGRGGPAKKKPMGPRAPGFRVFFFHDFFSSPENFRILLRENINPSAKKS